MVFVNCWASEPLPPNSWADISNSVKCLESRENILGQSREGFPEKPTVFESLSQTSKPLSSYVHMTESIFEPISILPNAK